MTPGRPESARQPLVWQDTGMLTLAGVAVAAVDVATRLAGQVTTGWAGPNAHLVIGLVTAASIPLLARAPRAVAGLALMTLAVMAIADVVSPGLLIPLEPITEVRVPTAVSVIIWYLARYRDRGTVLAVVPAIAVFGGELWNPSWGVTPAGLLGTVVPALLGLYFRSRSELVQALKDRAERSEREAKLRAEHARFAERQRLATEMHDVVSHSISLIVLRAGALGIHAPDDDTRGAAEEIRHTGARAIEELRQVVGVLHGDDPVGGVESAEQDERLDAFDVSALVAENRAVGVAVAFHVEGDHAAAPLPVRRAVYRLVQESLTNVRKHAQGAEVRVALIYMPTGVEVSVRDSGSVLRPDAVSAGAGVGLAGLRQRVESLGGTFAAGPDGTGFQVKAVLPVHTTETSW